MVDQGRRRVADRHLAEDLVVDHLGIVLEVVVILDPGVPDGARLEGLDHLVEAPLRQLLGQDRRVALAPLVGVEVLERAKPLAVQGLGQVPQVVERQRHETVGHAVDAVGRAVEPGGEIAVPVEGLGRGGLAHVEGQRLGLQVDAGVQEAGLDPRARAGAELPHVGRHDPHGAEIFILNYLIILDSVFE